MKQLKTTSGPWQERDVVSFLENTVIPIRLAALHPDGHPVILSLWFLYNHGHIYCACKDTAAIARLIEKNDRVGFEVAGDDLPYFGVRGRGKARIDPSKGQVVLEKLTDRYLGNNETGFRRWLLDSATNEVAIEITPHQFTSWDYRKRMGQ